VRKATPQRRRRLPFKDIDRFTEVNATLDRLESGGPFLHKRDGMAFRNREGKLPEGAHREYTVSTPGASNRGARRIIRDDNTGRTFYTDDHYNTFTEIDPRTY
jgi:guanyl-specific ribonuclease Sa